MRSITRGAAAGAGLIFHVFVQDSTSTTGAGKASIAFGSFSCRYIRNGEAISGAITPEDITTIGTYAAPTANTNIRIKAVDNTNMIGVYEVHIHADWVNTTNSCQSLTIQLTASGAAPAVLQIPLTGFNAQDTVRGGLTALPNAAADAAGGLIVSDAGGLDADAQLVTKINDILTDTGTTLQGELDGIQADTEDIQSRLPAALSGGRMDSVVPDTQKVDVNTIKTQAITCAAPVTIRADVGAAAAPGAANGMLIAGSNANTVFDNLTITNDLNAGGVTISSTMDVTGGIVANITGNLSGSVGSLTGFATNGSGLSAVPWNAAWDAEVQSEVQDAIEVNHLDHLLAVDYDPAAKPGVATALLNELIESDAGVSRYTANSLEQAPAGGGGGSSAADILAYDGSGVVVPDKCLLSLQRLMLNQKAQRVDGSDVYLDVYMEDNITVAFSILMEPGSPTSPIVGTGSSAS